MTGNISDTNGGIEPAQSTIHNGRRAVSRVGQSALRIGLFVCVLVLAGSLFAGVAAAADPVEIGNWTELQGIENDLDGNYVLVADLNESTEGFGDVAGPNANGGAGFEPLGDQDTPFTGTFDGGGYEISNLTIDRGGTNRIGLFGVLGSGGHVNDTHLANVSIAGSSVTGGLVGDNDAGTVNWSSVSGSVSGADSVGGVIGSNRAEIHNSSASVDANGNWVGGLVGLNDDAAVVASSSASGGITGDHAGGLVGYNNESAVVRSSSASGDVIGDHAGGLVGYNRKGGIVTSSSASGDVTGNDRAGGLVGWNWYGDVFDSTANGSVSGNSEVGGLAGRSNGEVRASNATGTVDGNSKVGGLVGWNYLGLVNASNATGTVDGDSRVGGLVGMNNGGVKRSYATGSVTGGDIVGGLVGQQGDENDPDYEDGSVKTSYATGAVDGGDWVGGLVGYNTGHSNSNTGSSVETSFAAGDVSANSRVGGLVGWNRYDGTVTDSYWDTQRTGYDKGVGDDDSDGDVLVTALSTAQMEGSASETEMNDLFASGVWTSVAGDYPDLVDNSRTVSTPRYAAPDDAEMAAILDDMETDADGFKIVMSDRALQAINRNATTVSDDYRLGIEIDASGTSEWYDEGDRPRGFDPIGDDTDQFTGTFNGSGVEITGLTIDRSGSDVGLFGYVGTGGAVERVDLEAVDVSGGVTAGGLVGTNFGGEVRDSIVAGSVSGADYVGGLVGYNFDGSVTGSHATSSVTGSGNFIGGLVGYNRADVEESYATGRVNGDQNVGGLVGKNEDGVVSVAYATGSVDGEGFVGGLVGDNFNGEITETYAIGSADGNSDIGGLVGGFGGDVTASYWDVETTGRSESAGSEDRYGLTTEQMSGLNATVEMFEFDFEEAWRPGETASDYPVFAQDSAFTETDDAYDALVAGDGSVESPYQVSNVYQLQRITMRLSEGDSFEVASDIDASRSAAWFNEGDGPQGFDPIGDNVDPFTGTFNGSSFEISELTISRSGESYVGLFGYVDSSGQVERVGLEAVDVSGHNAVGGLVGTNDGGEVTQSSVTGSVDGTGNVGGLAGSNIFDGSVSRSYAAVSVTGSGDWIGGLVGRNFAHMDESYATGSVEGIEKVGGLVGYHDGFINASYATGSVDGDAIVGGLVGENSGGEINQTYAVGPVDGNSQFGGLVGSNSGDVIESYWDASTTNQPESAGSNDRYGLTTEQMTGLNATVGMFEFDFEETWRPAADRRYPDLAVNSAFESEVEAYAGLVEGDGSVTDPFKVSTVYELQLVSVRLGGGDSFELAGDIDASRTAEWYDEGDGPRGFDPIGNAKEGFDGRINGSGFTISDLSINRSDESQVGLFGYVDQEGEIESVTLESVDVLGGGSVGGLAGTLHDGTVNRSSVTGTVNGSNTRVGGLAGDIQGGSVHHSTVNATVNGTSNRVGGLAGRLGAGTVTASNASGTVRGITDVGGLFGDITGGATVSDSSANVTVVGDGERIGGLVGDIFGAAGTVSGSYASGSVEGQTRVGGLVGQNRGTLRTSFATGTVTGSGDWIGGLVGYNRADVEESYATGSVEGIEKVGGLVGYNNDGFVNASYATGSVDGDAIVGGLVGENDGGEIESSSAAGAVSGTAGASNIGGLVGHNDGALISSSFATGAISDIGSNVGGLVGAETSGTVEASYWDLNTTGQNESAGDGTSLTTAQMTGFLPETTMEPLTSSGFTITDSYPIHEWSIDYLTLTLADTEITNGHATTATVGLAVDDRTIPASETADYDIAADSVATVDNGTVTGVGSGSTTISAAVAAVSDEVLLSVTSAPSSGGGGGGRPAQRPTEVTVNEPTDESSEAADPNEPDTRISVTNPVPGQTLVIEGDRAFIAGDDESDTADQSESDADDGISNVRSDRLSIEINTDRDFELSVTTYETDLERSVSMQQGAQQIQPPNDVRTAAASFETETDSVSAGYINVEHTLERGEISGATFEFSIRQPYLDSLGVDAEAVVLHHRIDDVWETRETEQIDADETHYRFSGTAPEFSVFALGTGAAQFEVTDVSLESDTIVEGETATVIATVENRGQRSSEYAVELAADGETVDSETIEIEGGASTNVRLSFVPELGVSELEVNGIDAATVTVERSDDVEETEGDDESDIDEPDEGWGLGWPLVIGGVVVLSYIIWRRYDNGVGERSTQDTDHRE